MSATVQPPTIPEPQTTSLGFRGRFLPSDDPGVLIGETWVAPGGGAGPLHRHLRQTERFEVLEGAITVRLGRERRIVGPGESIFVAAGVPHTFVNHTGAEAHFRTYFAPPLALEALFTALVTSGGKPSVAEAARLMQRFPDEFFYLPYLPVRAQRLIAAAVRALSRDRAAALDPAVTATTSVG
jgi:quercetin dioxygenase-like cupin family protein